MPTPTFTFPTPPTIPSGREIYDSIMSKIEPELVSSSLPTLNEKYKNETAIEKKARTARYNEAFAKYYKQYNAYTADLEEQVFRYHKEAMKSIEERSRLLEKSHLSSIGSAINAA